MIAPTVKTQAKGQNNLSRALKWGISCLYSNNRFGEIASMKNPIFTIYKVNLLVFTNLRNVENGYFHLICFISESI